jgi:hypothetical protein
MSSTLSGHWPLALCNSVILLARWRLRFSASPASWIDTMDAECCQMRIQELPPRHARGVVPTRWTRLHTLRVPRRFRTPNHCSTSANSTSARHTSQSGPGGPPGAEGRTVAARSATKHGEGQLREERFPMRKRVGGRAEDENLEKNHTTQKAPQSQQGGQRDEQVVHIDHSIQFDDTSREWTNSDTRG